MELFSEIYGCYYTVVSTILEKASAGITKEEIDEILNENAFYDSSFHMLPKLFSNEWDFIEKKEDKFYSKVDFSGFIRPLTTLEKSWVKTLLSDRKIFLFLSKDEVERGLNSLRDIDPLFYEDDFHIFDQALDGDNYEDESYRSNFKIILNSCKTHTPLLIEYENSRMRSSKSIFIPWKICYSKKDDKFRVLCEVIKGNMQEKATLNISRIRKIERIDSPFSIKHLHMAEYKNDPIVLEIKEERNALERCMLQFASWKKQTEYDEKTNKYYCKIFYDKQDETELLIRILGFGPVVKVLGPESFLKQIKKRISEQILLNLNA